MESAVIDVVIATVFFFVTLSLIVATITEFLSRALNLRSKNFLAGLEELVGKDLAAEIMNGKFAPPRSKGAVDHIEPRQFSLAMMQALDSGSIPDDLKDTLKTITKAAKDELSAVRKELEDWFDSAMTEVGIWYRKNAQVITRVVAAVLVLALNADTITLVDRAWKDKPLRESLVSAAAAAAEKPAPAGDSDQKSLENIKKDIEAQLDPFPIGWWNQGELTDWDYLKKPLGLLITFIALTLGAPFWFDVLKRVMKLRSQLQTVQRKKAEAAGG